MSDHEALMREELEERESGDDDTGEYPAPAPEGWEGPTREEIESVEKQLEDDEDDGPEFGEAGPDADAPTPLDRIIEANARVTAQKARVEAAKAALKEQRENLEGLQDALNYLIDMAALAKTQAEPDPQRYPLLDRPNGESAKDAVNGLFSKPVPIEPLPPEDFAEFVRRRTRDTRLEGIGLDGATVRSLERAGLVTVKDFMNKSDALVEANASFETIRGLDAAKVEAITEALVQLQSRWLDEWAEMHAGEGEG